MVNLRKWRLTKYSILPWDKFITINLNVEMQPTNINPRTFSNDIVPCKWKTQVTIMYKINLLLQNCGFWYDAINGRDWIRGLNIELRQKKCH